MYCISCTTTCLCFCTGTALHRAADLPAALPNSSPSCYPSALIASLLQLLVPSDEMGWALTHSSVSGHFLVWILLGLKSVLWCAFTWLKHCLFWQMESKWNAERQLHCNVRGFLPWYAEFWSPARKPLFWLARWGQSQSLVLSEHTSSESFWMTRAWVLHSAFLELSLEQTLWKRTSCRSQEAACRAVSELGTLPTRLSVSAQRRAWDWLVLTEIITAALSLCGHSMCPGCSPQQPHRQPPPSKGCCSGHQQTYWGTLELSSKKAQGWEMNGAAAASVWAPYGQLQPCKRTVAWRQMAFTLFCCPSALHSSTSKQKKLFILCVSMLVCGF